MPLFIGAIVAALLKVLFRYAVFKIFAKLILGTATAGVIYLFYPVRLNLLLMKCSKIVESHRAFNGWRYCC